ncbi:MAG TPA: hypothetical protein VIL36_17665 [Acidimicrobiales bacterium]
MTTATLLALSDGGYLAAGWGATVLLIGGYALVTLRRGRALSRRVPAEDRRWT